MANLDWSKYERLGGVVLPELAPVSHTDVEDWLSNHWQHSTPALKAKMSEEMKRLYADRKEITMEELTELLHKLMSERDVD